ncbi:uncharacterized protein LOC113217827 [Frankliniella occidentalis]|uniref:Uncharacterized protein LOC113217827 n=1 Tax=Frankliniella occidentalis TaxID=133901 RepID=A0A9C6UC39_FRAOC|nr:uncharacterized protein LOC113217827 [Frankliniella occidentalis]
MTPPHTCLRPLCACKGPPSAAAARLAATLAVAGLAARPALDLLESGGAAGAAAGDSGRGPCGALCRLCPGAAALTRTTLIVVAAVTLLALVALTVRLATAPPSSPPPPAATPVPAKQQVVAPVAPAFAATAAATARNGSSSAPPDQIAAMESAARVADANDGDSLEIDAGPPPMDVDGSSHANPAGDHLSESYPEAGRVVVDGVLDVSSASDATVPLNQLLGDAVHAETPTHILAAPDTSAVHTRSAEHQQPLNDDGGLLHEESAGKGDAAHARHRRPTTVQPRRNNFRPRYDHGAVAPAWKQFVGCALHLRPAAPAPAAPHKRHVMLRAPLPPLHVMAPAAWPAPPPQQQRFPAPLPAALWGLRLVPQQQQQHPVWGSPAASGPAAPAPAPWGQHVQLYAPAPGLPCQLCPPPVLHVPGAPTPAPPGPTWTC